MEKEISIPGDGVSTADEYDFSTSLYPSFFPPNYSPLPDNYIDDAEFDSGVNDVGSSMENESSIASCWRQIQQQQALMHHHQTIRSHLHEVRKQAHALRLESLNLKTANLELNNRMKVLLNTTTYHGVGLESDSDDKLGISKEEEEEEEEGTSENEATTTESPPTSLMDPIRIGVERVDLPKSISVRSYDYSKVIRAGEGGDSDNIVSAVNGNKIGFGTQKKVHIKGSEREEAVEVEVYKQGMFKTELCNKWQQTGTCPYGETCRFAHGIDELRPVIRHPRYKTELCRMLLNGIRCPYGHRCHFRHTLTKEEQLAARVSNPKSIELLNYW